MMMMITIFSYFNIFFRAVFRGVTAAVLPRCSWCKFINSFTTCLCECNWKIFARNFFEKLNSHSIRRINNPQYTETIMAREMKLIGITSLPSPTKNPLDLLEALIETNKMQKPNELLVFNLATVNEGNVALGRTMVFTGFDEEGLIFGTDRNSRKYADILKNPNVAMTFLFVVKVSGINVHQQIRINGVAHEASQSQIITLWNKEPVFAKVRSIIHAQKPKTIEETRSKYEQMVNDFEEGKFDIPLPQNTTYFIVKPNVMDFYQSSANHVADRITYTKKEDLWDMHRTFG